MTVSGRGTIGRLVVSRAAWHPVRGRRAVEGVYMRRFLADEQGQGMAEYALIIAVVALFMILTQVFFAGQLKNYFSNVGNKLT